MATILDRERPRNRAASSSKKALLVLLAASALRQGNVVAESCISFTSTVDSAGDPGPGNSSCSPYNVEISAAAGTVSLANASATAVGLAPALDVSVVVDESGSVYSLCSNSYDCYQNEKDFATELITLLNAAVGIFDKGGTGLYMEYSHTVNINEAYTTEDDYINGVATHTHQGGGTYIGTAIAAAKDSLLALPGREDRTQMMVVMTDGHEGGNTDPAGEAALAAAEGIIMYVVAVDVTSAASPTCSSSWFWPSCIDNATMLEVAGDPERLFVVDTFAGLADDVAAGVVEGIEIPCSTNATFTVELAKEPDAVPSVSSGEVEITGTTVTWTMDSVGSMAAMTFAADYCQCDYWETTVDFLDSGNFMDAETNDPSLSDLFELTAEVTELCPAPTSPPTPQPTVTAPDTMFTGVIDAADGAWEAAYSPDGTHVFLTGKESDSIIVFEAVDGSLTMVAEATTNSSGGTSSTGGSLSPAGGVPPGALDGPAALAVSPDGTCLFVAATGNGSLTSLRVDESGGGGGGTSSYLTYADMVSDEALLEAWDVVVSPQTGDHVYVSSPGCGCVMTFAVEPETCGLTYVSNVTESLAAPAGMSASPDGSFLYGTDSLASGGSLVVYSRNLNTGELTLLQTMQDGEGPFIELGNATPIAAGPSGRDVYVASSNPGALVHFCVDENTGELEAVEWGTNATMAMNGASVVTVAPTNSRVFVASTTNDTLWVLDVVDEAGSEGGCAVLELQDTIREGDGGRISGLAGARGIAVSPDGSTTLVVSAETGTISLFLDTSQPTARTPAPTVAPLSSSAEPWYEEMAVGLAIAGSLAAAGAAWLLYWHWGSLGCCCCFAACCARKKKIQCPACEEEIEVESKGLDERTSCSCDTLRAKAEIDNGGGTNVDSVSLEMEAGSGAAAGADGNKTKAALFHPDPAYVATCEHCEIVFCTTCDVRDEKRMFPYLFENNPEGEKEEAKD